MENVETAPATSAEATPTAPAVETTVVRKSPTDIQFVDIWNASESRKDALARFAAAGFTLSYNAMVAREKSYRAKGAKLKEIAAAPRGRRLDVAALNAHIQAAG